MPKRSHEDIEEKWRRKIRRYEKKLEKRRSTGRFRRIISSDSDSDDGDVQQQEHLECNTDLSLDNAMPPAEVEVVAENEDSNQMSDYDPSLVEALGEGESEALDYGEDIQEDLAKNFKKILESGLKKDIREELSKRYLFPKNVPYTKGPTLNPEIEAMLPEVCKLRDKRLTLKQNQLGRALSALGKAITCLLKRNPDVPDIIRILNDTGKILAYSHFAETDTRRSIIAPLIDKALSDPLKNRKRDEYLFGENLGELVRNSRGIKKTSQLIQASGNLNGRGSSTKTQKQRGGIAQRVGGPRPTTSYSGRRRAPQPAPPPPPARRQYPPPPARRPPPPAQVQRFPVHRGR